jgi:hypothetical protein
VHVANFDIVLVAREKLDQFHSLDTAGAACRKNLDFSALSCRGGPLPIIRSRP